MLVIKWMTALSQLPFLLSPCWTKDIFGGANQNKKDYSFCFFQEIYLFN